MSRPGAVQRCSVIGCPRPADTLIEGDNRLTGKPLPSVYACDNPEHQYAAAMAILPSGEPLPSASFGAAVKAHLARWNAEDD